MFDSEYFPYAVAVIIALPFLVFAKQFVNSFIRFKKQEINFLATKTNSEIKLQALERMTLFLERLKPSNLVMKFDKNLQPHEFIFLTEKNITEEFEYNASQQLYISKSSWEDIITSKNNILQSLRKTYEEMNENSKLEDFKTVFLMSYLNSEDYISDTIENLRKELNKII
ncbi:hypothetical protein NG800_012405 [Epilithonimonas ginsengisoli]|uniref:Uncharacterized protein n=1 Tax=Epilithonimonas ginsengisoli TaxID=1245592 RepID=A0ABU4JJ52_9FLAO|nr:MULTISPECIES: hypothetical protein [Chryseobacterium group]MBV6880265.1 hypothetical protein [Epilithonimonas sp. FP105]MDW8549717.1 hypothetical protein [Epilithonimonas ginsengisoli]OAH72201.1 hypothetical protein AXA65_10650 [Chryseobacterium sp. FP211-J200]